MIVSGIDVDQSLPEVLWFCSLKVHTPTLNTSSESACLFKVLSVDVFNLRCVSTFHKRPRMKHTGKA